MPSHSDFFLHPDCLPMRQYEALRAYLHEGCSIEEAAGRGHYTPGSFRNLLRRFRKQPSSDFFWPRTPPSRPGAKPADPRPARIVTLRRERQASIYQIQQVLQQENMPASLGYIQMVFTREGIRRLPRRPTWQRMSATTVADVRKLNLSARTFHTDFAGLFLFAFDLAHLQLDAMLAAVGMPGTRMIPAGCAVRSLLALKLSGIGRPSQVMAEALDEGLALFAGLNAIPKRTTLTEYSIQVDPTFAGPLMHRWYHAAAELSDAVRCGGSIDLDFHTIPYHGDQALLQKHYVSKRSRRQRGVLTVLARDADARLFCYADTTIRKETQNDAILRFVDYWKAHTGKGPKELVFDSRFTVYANLARLAAQGIDFITLRRRHASLIEHIDNLDKSAWRQIRLTNIGRAYRTPRIADETVKLRGYARPLRQIIVKGLGHHKPTVLITNQMKRSAAQLVDRYARRMMIENVISDAINFFHMEALSSAVPMRINVDVQLTVMARVLYRLLGARVGEGYEKAESRTIYRDLVRHSGTVTLTDDEILVRLRARSKAHYLVSAGFPKLRRRIPWLDNKMLRIQLSKRP